MTGLTRRGLIGAAGMGLALGAGTGQAAMRRASVPRWDLSTDVLVLGSGGAGISAALEARSAGREVLLLESMPRLGGSSTLSGGVVYAGGGTALQRALGVEDSVEAMYDFIVQGGPPHPEIDKIQLYCEQSPAHFDWLVEQGVSYSLKFTQAKGLPMGDESLYYSGNEQAWPAREGARPAPRGHVPGVMGMNGGRHLMAALIARARAAGVTIRPRTDARQLIVRAGRKHPDRCIPEQEERKCDQQRVFFELEHWIRQSGSLSGEEGRHALWNREEVRGGAKVAVWRLHAG